MIPASGTPGIRWNKDRRKWMVRHTVKGVEHYLGLFADLAEARRVKAAAVIEHGYKNETGGRGREDSTAHVPDAELDERFMIDDDGDPAWRPKPVVGDDAIARDNARWNSKEGGKKLGPRPKYKREGIERHMYREDILARLLAMADKTATPAEPEAADVVPLDWPQRGGIPQDAATPGPDDETPAEAEADEADAVALDGRPAEPGDYEAALAEALEMDPQEREVLASALEGKIIPATPIGQGPLARALMKVKRAYDMRKSDLMVLSSGKDPFGIDTPIGHALGRWLRVRLNLHAPGRIIHLRGIHYLLVGVQAIKPDGTRYENTKADYFWLNDRVAKAARWLRYIGFDDIVDERNEEAIKVHRSHKSTLPMGFAYAVTGYDGRHHLLPAPMSIDRATLSPGLSGFQPERRFCFVAFGEKSSLAEILEPFARRHEAHLYIAVGELSELAGF